uniref:C2H2-type domain-containing protein n=1 Tax=Pogona vitticeps TaxID=103695 RepID=A0ABM5ET29_9SAUR
MEVGAEIELTEDGTLEELPLHLENAKNCLSWESLDISSSDDDGEAYFTFCLPVRRPSRPAQRLPVQRLSGPRLPAQRLPAPPPVAKPAACEKWIPPLYPCPVRPIVPTLPAVPVFGAYQCQKCLQVFMEEWHYSQHLEDHAQEEAQQKAAQVRPRTHSPPRKLRCLECGKRFLRPEHFARHTKWHLKLVRKGIKVSRRKASRRSSQVSFVYKPLGGGGENPSEVVNNAGLLVAPENARQPVALQVPRLQKASKRKAPKHQKRMPVQVVQNQGLVEASCPENSMAILDGDVGLNLLQPWQKQETLLEGQVAGGLFQPAILNPENQIIIVDDDAEEALSVTPEHHHYTEVQTAIFDSQGNVNAGRPLFLRAEDPPVAILDAQGNLSSLQFGGTKDQGAVASGWVGQNLCTLLRTVLLQAEEPQATVVDGQVESSPHQQVIIKTSEVSPTLYLDPDTHLSSVDPSTLHFVPLHQEPQFVTVSCENALTLDQADPAAEGEKTDESQVAAFQFPGYLPNVYQQNKPPPPTVATSLSPKGSLVVRLVPGPSGDHPEVLDLEYDTGGGIPVASEPWEATNARTGPEAYATEEVAEEENFIVVEMEGESQGQGFVVGGPSRKRPRRPASRRTRRPAVKTRVGRFKCPDCGVRYSRVSQLRTHQKGPKRRGRSSLCECGAPFRGLLHLLRHQLQHLDEALFICATCGKSLKGHKGLARHDTCHPGPARFSCPCGVGFKRLTRYLWHHVRSQKPGLRVYTLSGFLAST